MKLLLDTHIFLWAVEDSERLKASTRRLIERAEAVFVSAASIWEVAIKAKLGKIQVDPDRLVEAIEECGFQELSITAEHAATVMVLALHHRDPFDRLLIAQAISEVVQLVTSDDTLPRYSELVVQV